MRFKTTATSTSQKWK